MSPAAFHWRVVLVRARNPLNIGAAARAMANFGLRDLAAVAPYDPSWQEARSAPGAEEILQAARATATLAEALDQCSLVIGTTAGARRHLDRDLISLKELPEWLESRCKALPRGEGGPERAALLFGSEKTGLSNEELSYCHALVRIPTATECPSMNLGQAVAVCCYELARSGLVSLKTPVTRVHHSSPASVQSLEHLFQRACAILDESGYLKPKSRAATVIKLRRLLFDLGLTNNDVRILGGVLAQIEWRLRHPG
jgi:TrmH family RNA methyltransferase